MSLKLLLLSAGLLPSLLLSSTADVTQQPSVSAAKRFSINMMDPFTRRSALDKNFVRFGRSGTQRVPRGRNDNFVRFGRSGAEKTHVDDEDDVTMFPSKESELIRLARARADNFIRFGRAGRPDNFIRFGRGMDRANNGFIRFGRGRPDNFIRFGRGRPDNFIRFGRGRPDNFIRFGRDQQQSDIENRLKLVTDAENQLKLVTDAGNQLKLVTDAENQFKPAPGTEIKLDASDFSDEDGDDYSFERVMRGSNSKLNSNFVRFGKRVPENNEEIVNAYKNGLKLDSPQGRDFLERFIRLPSRGNMKSDSFIRFGRSLEGEEGNKNEEGKSLFRENSSEESSDEEENFEDSKLTSRDPNIVGTSYESSASSQTLSRKKRSVDFDEKNRDKNLVNENSNQSSSFYSPLAAGLPGLILGPELSMLPVKENSKTCNDSKEEKTKNFIRLG